MALKFGGDFRPVTKVKARTTNLEDVIFQAKLSSSKMLNQYREGMEALATHVCKKFGGFEGPLAAQAIHGRKEPVGEEPDEPQGIEAVSDSIVRLDRGQ